MVNQSHRNIKHLIFFALLSGCISLDMHEIINSKNVNRIEIRNGTTNHYIADKISVTNRSQIDWLISEVNRMTLLDSSVDVRNNFGEYDMNIEMSNNKEMQFIVIYTTYDGVVIQGYNKSGTAMDAYYKNDQLERAILHLFQP